MTCPACGNALASGHERCAFCGALVAPAAAGALAPDHASVTPPGRGRAEGLREIGSLRKRERSWKDEVNDRMRNRRQRGKAGAEPAELPLFDGPRPRDDSEAFARGSKSTPEEAVSRPEPIDRNPPSPSRDTRPFEGGSRSVVGIPEVEIPESVDDGLFQVLRID